MATFDVGVVPLAPNRFNLGKSALKFAEMCALGVPAVVSPTPDNLRLHRLGAGRLATRPRDWAREVGQLLRDPVLRQELVAQGRQVAAELTVEANAWRTWEAWEEALQRRQGLPLQRGSRRQWRAGQAGRRSGSVL